MTIDRLKIIIDDIHTKYPTATIDILNRRHQGIWFREISFMNENRIIASVNVEDGTLLNYNEVDNDT